MTSTGADQYALRMSPAEQDRYRMMAELAREAEADLWAIAGLSPGAVVADVGCGPGGMFPALVAAVGDTGRVVAVDGDPEAVAAAEALVQANGWTNVSVRVGRADDTGIEPGSVDVVNMRHVLAHNGPREQQIVNHLATLVKPGGNVYLVDIDAAAMRVRPTNEGAEEMTAAYLRFHAQQGNDLETGLRLRELLAAAGLEVVAYRGWYNIVAPPPGVRPPAWAARNAMVAAGVATEDDLARWEAALDELGEQRPTIFATLFGAVGHKP
jgi:ubiquinone/menaquinone biosynthesis C-methylase UbiE